MADLDIGQTTTTDLKGTVKDVTVDSAVPDALGLRKWTYPDAPTHLGYYKSIPEINSALRALGIYVCGQGWESETHQAELEGLTGWGEDSFQSISKSLVIEKKVFGDSFA